MPTLTPNQIVAHNLARARQLHGWTQEEAAERLEPMLGARWSKASFSAAERSIDGERVREFTADELVAFARVFGVSVAWLFIPPTADEVGATEAVEIRPARGASLSLTPLELLETVYNPDVGSTRIGRVVKSLPATGPASLSERVRRHGQVLAAGMAQVNAAEYAEMADRLRELARVLEEAAETATRWDAEAPDGSSPVPPLAPRRHAAKDYWTAERER